MASEKCEVCGKTVYATEKISADEKTFHKTCFKCTHCGKTISLGNYAALNGTYYCKPHFKQLFKEKGNYNEGFGHKKLTDEWAERAESPGSEPKDSGEKKRVRIRTGSGDASNPTDEQMAAEIGETGMRLITALKSRPQGPANRSRPTKSAIRTTAYV